MEKPKEPANRSTEKKPPLSTNMIWLLLIAAVVTLFLVFGLSGQRQYQLEYSQLLDLVEQSNPEPQGEIEHSKFIALLDAITKKDGPQHVDVRDESDEDSPQWRFSQPTKARITEDHVVVWLTRQSIQSNKGQPEQILVTVTGLDSVDELRKSLEEASIPLDEIQGYVDVQDEEKEKTYRYSQLSDIEIGDFEINGSVHRKLIASSDSDDNIDEEEDKEVTFKTSKSASDEIASDIAKKLESHGIPFRFTDGPSMWRAYLPLLLMIGLFILIFFFMMRRMGGAGSPMAFGRSRGKQYGQDEISITFEDVAGVDEAREELKEVVEFLRTPEKFQTLGGRIPKGVLLVGPPGTGKTLLGKAIAGEANVPFFCLSGSDFVEMFVGVGAARVRDMFQQATAKAPSIIFIDELDALGKTRGNNVVGGHDEREQTLNALLVEMDGFGSNSGVIIMAATNRPETLDPALLRPGRFDRQVLVDRPDVRGREEILKVHVKNVKLSDSVNLKRVAGITSGFVGADLANLVNEAALLAARKSKKSVDMEEFDEGVERVTAGLEKKQRYIHEDEKQRVAYHESGHALVAYSLPNTDPVHKVSIIPRGFAALGYTMQRPEEDRYLMTQGELESRIQVFLAGTMAEELIYDDISTGAQNDLERATEIARSMVMQFGMSRLGRVNFRESNHSPFMTSGGELSTGSSHSEQTAREIDEEVKRIIDEGLERVRETLQTRRASLVALTERLLEKEVIDGEELRQIIEQSSPTPKIVPGTTDQKKTNIPKPDFGTSTPDAAGGAS